jgi:hypothetical protein
MNNEFKEITKEEAIKAIHRYILCDNPDDRELVVQPFHFCYIVFSDGYLFNHCNLWNQNKKSLDSRTKRDIVVADYILNKHGLNSLELFVLSFGNISIAYNGLGIDILTFNDNNISYIIDTIIRKREKDGIPCQDIYEREIRQFIVEKTQNIKSSGYVDIKDVPDNIRYYFQFDNMFINDLYGSDVLIAFEDAEYFFDYSDFYYYLETLWNVLEKHGFDNLLCFCIQNNNVNIYCNNSGIEFNGDFIDEYTKKVVPKYHITCKPFCDFINEYVDDMSAVFDEEDNVPIIDW